MWCVLMHCLGKNVNFFLLHLILQLRDPDCMPCHSEIPVVERYEGLFI